MATSSPSGTTKYHDHLRGLVLKFVPARTNVSIENLLNAEIEDCYEQKIVDEILIERPVGSKKPTNAQGHMGDR